MTLTNFERETIINFNEPEKQKSAKATWDEVVYYLDGFCYGVAPDGQIICLGDEADIKAMLADPTKRADDPRINEIIDLERELTERGNTNGKQPQLQRPGTFRGRTAGKAKRGATHIKPSAFRKRLSGNPTKCQVPGVSGK